MKILRRTNGIDLKAKNSALRGDVCFQLKDALTGKITHEERGHNMLTNGLNSALNGCPYQLNKIDSGYGNTLGTMLNMTPLYKQLLGGVILFPQALGDDADLLFPSFANSPVGFASLDENYSQTDSRQGTYDGTSSGMIANGYKHVFDWGSAFGNGTIASLGLSTRLCHNWCNSLDTGFAPFVKSDTQSGFVRQLHSARIRVLAVSEKGMLILNSTSGYSGWNNILFYKFYKPFTVSIFEDVNKYLTNQYMYLDVDHPFGDDSDNTKSSRGYTWKLDNAIGTGGDLNYSAQIVGDYIYLVYHSGGTFTVKKLNIADGSVASTDTYTFSGAFGTGRAVLYGNYIYCVANVADKIIKADITRVSEQEYTPDEITATGVTANSRLHYVGTQFIYADDGILDAEADIFEVFNGSFGNGNMRFPVADLGMWLVMNTGYSNMYLGATMKTWGLMTHYDLQNPVPKDTSKQMIVSYSITQV